MSIFSKMGLAALAMGTLGTVTAARADVITVKGKATVIDVDNALLANLGLSSALGSVIEFEYSYDSTPPPTPGRPDGENSAGYFKFKGLSASDFSLVMSGVYPDNMITWGFDGADYDQYGSLANKTTTGGMDYRAFSGFADLEGTVMPENIADFVHPEHPKALLDSALWDERVVGISVLAQPSDPALTWAVRANITEMLVTAIPDPTPGDSDGDGVPDGTDVCTGTSSGQPTNSAGCSVTDLVPCAAPLGGGTWRNHGKYVSAFVKIVQEFFEQGLITEAEKDALIEGAGNSTCGRP